MAKRKGEIELCPYCNESLPRHSDKQRGCAECMKSLARERSETYRARIAREGRSQSSKSDWNDRPFGNPLLLSIPLNRLGDAHEESGR